MLSFICSPLVCQELFKWCTAVINCISFVFTPELDGSIQCFPILVLSETPNSIFPYLLELWDLLSHIAQVAELLKLQSRPAATSFVDLDLNPSQSEKSLTSPKKLSIEVISSVEYVGYKTQRALQSFVLLP